MSGHLELHFNEISMPRFSLLIGVFLAVSIGTIQGNDIECGTVNLFRELILGGNEALRDQWPFIAALYHSRNFKYFCGGTIISNRHVLTAAHCIHGKFSNMKVSADQVMVRLGAYNLTAERESGAVDFNVTQIYLHPDWNVHVDNYDADIAILTLSDIITFSNHIRPICMPTDDFNFEGLKGTVVGWGLTENGTVVEGIPRQTETNALNDTYCYRTDHGIARYTSERSFCGGLGDGTPNKGDSGGGFFAIFGSVWVQYGTVSVVRTNETGHITVSSFAVYSKVNSFKQWISDTVKQISGCRVSEASMKINLHCSYEYDTDGVYGCWLHDLDIRKENFVVSTSTGLHKIDKMDRDVELIVFDNGTMFFIPDKLGIIFQNLKYLTVGKDSSMSIGTRRIGRSIFQNLQNLEDLRFYGNDIEEIDADSLWDLPNLQSFQLEKSKLKALHATTFARNDKLKIVYVMSSSALRVLPQNLLENNFALEVVALSGNSLETIDERTFESNGNLRKIFLEMNRLEVISGNLFKNNTKLVLINLSSNAIKTVEEKTFRTNFRLKHMALGSNKLEVLPGKLFENNLLLETIILTENSLKIVPKQLFETNWKIREIHLRRNQLKVIPRNLFRQNFLLEIVDIHNNYVETIDDNLFQTNFLLAKISLASNRLDDLPRNLFKHNSMLEYIDVRNNFLETISEHIFETNVNLKEVYAEGNHVEFLPKELFANNLLLEVVDFGNNSLKAIDEQSFRTNANLREVYLSSNMLESLPTNVFRNNVFLEVVDLSKNNFKTIDANIFEINLKLQKVSFESNRLESLPRNLFRSNSLLQHIDFRDNYLKIIETIFVQLKEVSYINFYQNSCIDAVFYSVSDSRSYRNKFQNLDYFQGMLLANCTSNVEGTN